MNTSYADYVKWDTARREQFPTAKHWIYKSWIDEFKVAEWDPKLGWIDVRQK